jgi:hypothetical protein
MLVDDTCRVIDSFGAAEQTRGYNLDADSVTG